MKIMLLFLSLAVPAWAASSEHVVLEHECRTTEIHVERRMRFFILGDPDKKTLTAIDLSGKTRWTYRYAPEVSIAPDGKRVLLSGNGFVEELDALSGAKERAFKGDLGECGYRQGRIQCVRAYMDPRFADEEMGGIVSSTTVTILSYAGAVLSTITTRGGADGIFFDSQTVMIASEGGYDMAGRQLWDWEAEIPAITIGEGVAAKSIGFLGADPDLNTLMFRIGDRLWLATRQNAGERRWAAHPTDELHYGSSEDGSTINLSGEIAHYYCVSADRIGNIGHVPTCRLTVFSSTGAVQARFPVDAGVVDYCGEYINDADWGGISFQGPGLVVNASPRTTVYSPSGRKIAEFPSLGYRPPGWDFCADNALYFEDGTRYRRLTLNFAGRETGSKLFRLPWRLTIYEGELDAR